LDTPQGENNLPDTARKSIPEYHWKQRQRVLSRGIKPRAEMLSEDGYKRQEYACISGITGKRSHDAILCIVKYDDDYVAERLAREFGELISEVGRNDFLKLYSKAKARYRELQQQ